MESNVWIKWTILDQKNRRFMRNSKPLWAWMAWMVRMNLTAWVFILITPTLASIFEVLWMNLFRLSPLLQKLSLSSYHSKSEETIIRLFISLSVMRLQFMGSFWLKFNRSITIWEKLKLITMQSWIWCGIILSMIQNYGCQPQINYRLSQ